MRPGRLLSLFILLVPAVAAADDSLTVAVASNFANTAGEIASAFTEDTGIKVRVSPGSTGKLYGQIVNGAPFDVLLAADRERPEMLEKSGLGAAGTRRVYAIGSLVLWSRDPGVSDVNCLKELSRLNGRRLAIANPDIAPYGRAAVDFLRADGYWEEVRDSLVYGENISQVLQFVATGNAKLGLVAASQVSNENLPQATCLWPVPSDMHDPIEQQAIVVASSRQTEQAGHFLNYLCGDRARALIEAAGYRVPECIE